MNDSGSAMISPGTLLRPLRKDNTILCSRDFAHAAGGYELHETEIRVCPINMAISHVREAPVFEGIVFFLCEHGVFWTWESEFGQRFELEEDDS